MTSSLATNSIVVSWFLSVWCVFCGLSCVSDYIATHMPRTDSHLISSSCLLFLVVVSVVVVCYKPRVAEKLELSRQV